MQEIKWQPQITGSKRTILGNQYQGKLSVEKAETIRKLYRCPQKTKNRIIIWSGKPSAGWVYVQRKKRGFT